MIEQSHLCQACHPLFTSETNLCRLARRSEGIDAKLTITREMSSMVAAVEIGCPLCGVIFNALKDDELAPSPIEEEENDVCLQFTAYMMGFESEEAVNGAGGACKAASVIIERPITKVRKSNRCFDLVDSRLQECLRGHKNCHHSQLPSLPTRVIDVGDDVNPMKLICTNGQSGNYTALSYCWGMPRQPIMAEQETTDALMQGISPGVLPQTIADAVTVTKHLGLQYLWVDSLCIIQDSEEDKDTQIGRIPEIFSNAMVTISAGSARSCVHGFLEEQALNKDMSMGSPAFQDFEMPYLCPDGELDKIVIQTLQNFIPESQPVNDRAWTLEERLLSPRVLVYATNMVVWQCQFRECTIEGRQTRIGNRGGVELSSWTAKNRVPDEFFRLPLSNSTSSHPLSELDLQGLRHNWCTIICDHSLRRVTQGRDRLRAISGLAAKFAHVFSQEEYKAGLWYSNIHDRSSYFLCQLLWYCSPTLDQITDRDGDDLAPSWSWASIAGPIDFLSWNDPIDRDPGRVLECIAEPCSAKNTFGRVNGGQDRDDLDRSHKTQYLKGGKAYARVPREIDPGYDLHISIDDRCDHLVGQSFEVTFARLLEHAGLILKRNGVESFERIGVFMFASFREYLNVYEEHLDMANDLFIEGSTKTVVIV